jgi:hypothetical protein
MKGLPMSTPQERIEALLKPPRWPFLIPVPVAMAIAILIQVVRFSVLQGSGPSIFLIAWSTICVCFRFPLGLVNAMVFITPLSRHPEFFVPASPAICIVGWVLYAYLAFDGLAKPTQKKFLIFCLLLVINVVGTLLPPCDIIVPLDLD